MATVEEHAAELRAAIGNAAMTMPEPTIQGLHNLILAALRATQLDERERMFDEWVVKRDAAAEKKLSDALTT